ncbi:ketopantoate reductase family protein [Sphingosinicella sp. CPCC 101087]|uniref:ketopantoate reductase family protein n=1 Tax=Sphingosinicella sp. CPCC 101087 TaxID=2497754 RepID=UPI001FB0B353|nr:ketopantoate reductase family protein [Sphingosinicella sp. CPCC 101087]
MDINEVVIVGAGAMGCLFAAKLAECGASVTLVDVDRGRLDSLGRDGITLRDDEGERTVPVRALTAAQVEGPADLVMLFTKSMHSEAAAASVGHLARPGVTALTLQNGIGNAEALAKTFAPASILMGVTDFPADLEGPTRIASHGKGHVRLGGHVPQAQAAAPPVAELFNRSGLETDVDPQVQAAVWEKVAFNAALNAMATVTGLTVGGMDAPPGRRIAGAIVGEVVAVAAAHGIELDRAPIDAKVDFAMKNHRGHKASMLQDRLAGRPTEIETINGAVARFGEARGVATPVTATLADLVRLLEISDGRRT